ncbi:thiol-disulfide oxidoreductase DCC family protein [Candidatus Foliamicus sp.]
MKTDSNILVFDGMCNLCSSVIDFITARDSGNAFTLIPMQSAQGQMILREYGLSIDRVETFLLVRAGDALIKSDAAVAIASALRFPWNILRFMRFVPRPVRDGIYSLVSRNRYRLLGKRATCRLPD